MILHWDGSWPLLMVVLMITFFFMTRKEKKERDKIQNRIDNISAHIKELDILDDKIAQGQKVFKKSDFSHLTPKDFALYNNVKFV